MRTLICIQVAALLSATGAIARAADDDDDDKPAWQGSIVTYRNAVTTLTLDPGAELTYDPTYVMSVGVRPRWWFTGELFAQLEIEFARELTEANDTTYAGETLVGDLRARFGASRFATIPGVGIDLSADIELLAPTSKVAQAASIYLGLSPGVSLSRTFDLLEGLNLSYGFRFTKFFNRYTTTQREASLIDHMGACTGSSGGCGAYWNLGQRNVSWRLTNAFDLGFDPLRWLGARATFAVLTDFLYEATETREDVSYEPQRSTDNRHALFYELEIYATPIPALEIGIGLSTLNPQLAPDSKHYAPFFNRYSVLYLDIRLDIAGLVSQLTPADEEPPQ